MTTPPSTTIYLTKSGVFIPLDILLKPDRIFNYFIVRKKVLDKITLRKIAKREIDKNRIIIPRAGYFELLSITPRMFKIPPLAFENLLQSGKKITLPPSQIIPNPNQKLIIDHILSNFYTNENKKQGKAGLILNLDAGQGKSYIGAQLINHIKLKTLIIIHSTSILDQWKDVLKKAYPTTSIGCYYGSKKTDGDIVLMIINSALSAEFILGETKFKPLDYFSQFGFIIYDECHLYSHKTGTEVFKRAQAPYMLGLSATPGENPIPRWYLGPILQADKVPGYHTTQSNFQGKVYQVIYEGPPEYTKHIINESNQLTNVAATIGMICEDPTRNQLIVEIAIENLQHQPPLYTYIFADRREYLMQLKDLLELRAVEVGLLTSDEDFKRLVGGSKQQDLTQAETKSRIILATYSYMGTGKSITKMNSVILATPRKTGMRQFIGRIFRLGSDESITRKIYDIVDKKIVLRSQASSRKAYYKEQGFEIEQIQASHWITSHD
jgi:hypothetical protein